MSDSGTYGDCYGCNKRKQCLDAAGTPPDAVVPYSTGCPCRCQRERRPAAGERHSGWTSRPL